MVLLRSLLFNNRLVRDLKIGQTDLNFKMSSAVSGRNLLRLNHEKQRQIHKQASDTCLDSIIFSKQNIEENLGNNESLQISPLRSDDEDTFSKGFVTNEIQKNDIIEALDLCEAVMYCKEDENRNSIIKESPVIINSTEMCEVTATEITERKTKKKKSAVHTFRNFVRATIITLPSETKDWLNKQPSECLPEAESLPHEECSSPAKTPSVPRRKKLSSVVTRTKKNRSRIHNEGASLWTPMVRRYLLISVICFFIFDAIFYI